MFVLLEHQTPTGTHWDFMLERVGQQRLATWRLRADPTRTVGPIDCEAIGDHRREYLDYEGALTDQRGTVRRIDRGTARVLSVDAGRIAFMLDGERLRGHFSIGASKESACVFAPS